MIRESSAKWDEWTDWECSLDELVETANELLPRYLPIAEIGDARLRDQVNARLVRHLASLGLIDEPQRKGREARYGTRHLLQLLTTRRLMAEGYTTGAVKKLLSGAEEAHLKALLQGEVTPAPQQVSSPLYSIERGADDEEEEVEMLGMLSPQSNNALDFLRKAQARAAGEVRAQSVPRTVTAPALGVETWKHIRVSDSLEIRAREDFKFPITPHEQEQLLQAIEAALKKIMTDRRIK